MNAKAKALAFLQKEINMKRITAIFLVLVLCLSLCGCSTGEKNDWYDYSIVNDTPISYTLENGDSYYIPETSHYAFDDDGAVLYYNNLMIVMTKTDLDDAKLIELAQSVGGEIVGTVRGGIHSVQIKIPDTNLAGINAHAQTLMQDENVLYAGAEYPLQIMTMIDENPWTNDPSMPQDVDEQQPGGLNWWAEAIGAYTAWEYADKCAPVNIGIMDNGFDPEHEDLIGKVNMINDNTQDEMSDHGTACLSVMAANNNNIGIRGIASAATFYCADGFTGGTPDSDTIGQMLAIYNFMAQKGVCAVNNSWGVNLYTEKYYKSLNQGNTLPYKEWCEKRFVEMENTARVCITMIAQLVDSGYDKMIFVQAAGNGYVGTFEEPQLHSPAEYSGFFDSIQKSAFDKQDLGDYNVTYEDIEDRIMRVGAAENTRDHDGSYMMAPFSSYGETVDIFAPGMMVYSADKKSYSSSNGTSLAAPQVTASIGYIWSLDPSLSAGQVRDIILGSAVDKVSKEIDGKTWTYPMLNVGNAAKMTVEK